MTRNLIKAVAGVAVAGGIMFAGIAFASAATISDARFSNNQTSIDATGNSTVSGTFTLTVGAGEVVEWLRLIPAGNPFTEQSVGGAMGYQEGVYTNVPFSVKVPPNTGTYNVDIQGAGIWGGNRAINGGDSVVVWPTSVGSVRVVATGSTTSDPSPVLGGEDFWTKLAALIAGLLKAQTPAKPACPPSGSTSQVQAWLLGNGYASGFHAAGVYAPTGNWGPITTAAHAQAVAACK